MLAVDDQQFLELYGSRTLSDEGIFEHSVYQFSSAERP